MVRSSKISYELIHEFYGPQIYFHGYQGSVEETRRYPQAIFGFHQRMLSLAKVQKLIAHIPIHQIVIESDNHYQKGDLQSVIANIAQIKSCSTSDIIKITRDNTLRWIYHK